jgi:hypothetical protein
MTWMTGNMYTVQGVIKRVYAMPPSEAADVLGCRGEQMRPLQNSVSGKWRQRYMNA